MTIAQNARPITTRIARSVGRLAFAVIILPLGMIASAQNAFTNADELQAAYSAYQTAAEQGNYRTAYSRLGEAVRMARKTESSEMYSELRDLENRIPKQWGNKALKSGTYDRALSHFEKGIV